MKHELASEKLLELAYGELSPGEARDVQAHAAVCEPCRAELARIGETRSLMAQLPVEPAPERGERIVMAAAREAVEARGRKRPSILPPWLWAGSIGAMAAAVIAVVSWQLTREPIGPSLRPRESELMGSAKSSPAAAPGRPVAAAPAAPEEPIAAKRKVEPAKREEKAGALADAGAPQASRDSAKEEAPAPRLAFGSASGGGAAQGNIGIAAKADAEAEVRRLAGARSAERKAAATAASARRPRQAPGTVEVRIFSDCPGERRRVVEYSFDGSLFRYVREGARRTIEQLYSPEGALVQAFAIEGGFRRPLPIDAPGLVRDSRDAEIDAPPRCEP